MRPIALAVALLLLGSALLPNSQGLAQAPDGLFEDALAPEALAQADPPAHVLRQRFVTFRADRLAESRVTLNLFPDVTVAAALDRLDLSSPGFTTWIGHVEGEAVSTVSLTLHSGTLVGLVQIGVRTFEIRGTGHGVTALSQIDPSRLPPDGEAQRPPMDLPTPERPPQVGEDDGSTIDVLVVVNRAARDALGGANAMVAWINQQLANGNAAYANSGIIQRLRLVGITDVDYTQSGDALTDRNSLTVVDNKMDEVLLLRNAVAADVVHLVISASNACGIAWLMEQGDDVAAFESKGFSLSLASCSHKHSFVHEIGHNMGANHAAVDPVSPTPLYTYAFGYKNQAAGWRTIMAYECWVGPNDHCPRVLHFSNPARLYNNLPTGTPGTNNALVHNVNRNLVSNFRASNGKSLPGVPGTPTVVIASGQATVSWTAPTFGSVVGSYMLEAGTTPGASDLVQFNVGTSRSIRAAAPPRGKYYLRVVALNPDGHPGAASDDYELQVGPTGPPNAPRGLTAGVSGNTVTLAWLAPLTGQEVAGYILEAGGSAGGTFVSLSTASTALTATGPDGLYYARVRSINELGISGPSNEVSFRLGVVPPNAPINLTGAIRQSRVDLFWSHALTGGQAEGFILEAGSSSGARNLVNGSVGMVTTFSATAPTGRYFVRVRAYNRGGVSAPSNEIVLTPDAGACAGDISATLSWNTPTDIDLHVVEPNGSHVYYSRKQGTTARLDRDNTSGYGPENICVFANASLTGNYEVFIVPFGGSSYPTTATITVRTRAGTSSERYQVITRVLPAANRNLGYRVALLNGRTSTISEITGTRVPPP